jgi:hypothetical protein
MSRDSKNAQESAEVRPPVHGRGQEGEPNTVKNIEGDVNPLLRQVDDAVNLLQRTLAR